MRDTHRPIETAFAARAWAWLAAWLDALEDVIAGGARARAFRALRPLEKIARRLLWLSAEGLAVPAPQGGRERRRRAGRSGRAASFRFVEPLARLPGASGAGAPRISIAGLGHRAPPPERGDALAARVAALRRVIDNPQAAARRAALALARLGPARRAVRPLRRHARRGQHRWPAALHDPVAGLLDSVDREAALMFTARPPPAQRP